MAVNKYFLLIAPILLVIASLIFFYNGAYILGSSTTLALIIFQIIYVLDSLKQPVAQKALWVYGLIFTFVLALIPYWLRFYNHQKK